VIVLYFGPHSIFAPEVSQQIAAAEPQGCDHDWRWKGRARWHPKTERPGLARPQIGWRRLSASTGYCPHPSNPAPLHCILQIIL